MQIQLDLAAPLRAVVTPLPMQIGGLQQQASAGLQGVHGRAQAAEPFGPPERAMVRHTQTGLSVRQPQAQTQRLVHAAQGLQVQSAQAGLPLNAVRDQRMIAAAGPGCEYQSG